MKVFEITGFLFGIAGVWLTIKKNIWCFPTGLVNVTLTGWLVWNQQLYADFLQQVVYFILLVYGWMIWAKPAGSELPVSRSSRKNLIIWCIIFMTGSVLMGFFLDNYTDASIPYIDSTGTTLCFIAQWMIAFKKIENWYLWMAANLLYIFIYFFKDLPLYAVLSAIYLILSVAGLVEWRKKLTAQIS